MCEGIIAVSVSCGTFCQDSQTLKLNLLCPDFMTNLDLDQPQKEPITLNVKQLLTACVQLHQLVCRVVGSGVANNKHTYKSGQLAFHYVVTSQGSKYRAIV